MPAADLEAALYPEDLATAPFGLGPVTSTISPGTWEESLPPLYLVMGDRPKSQPWALKRPLNLLQALSAAVQVSLEASLPN